MTRTTSHPFRTARREAALKRQAARESRTTVEQMLLVGQRRGASKRESFRLAGRYALENGVAA